MLQKRPRDAVGQFGFWFAAIFMILLATGVCLVVLGLLVRLICWSWSW